MELITKELLLLDGFVECEDSRVKDEYYYRPMRGGFWEDMTIYLYIRKWEDGWRVDTSIIRDSVRVSTMQDIYEFECACRRAPIWAEGFSTDGICAPCVLYNRDGLPAYPSDPLGEEKKIYPIVPNKSGWGVCVGEPIDVSEKPYTDYYRLGLAGVFVSTLENVCANVINRLYQEIFHEEGTPDDIAEKVELLCENQARSWQAALIHQAAVEIFCKQIKQDLYA